MISIIIPALNEEKNIKKTILSAQSTDCEIIVADGGSSDRTVEIASSLGCKIVVAEKGRAQQMNEGASFSKGEIVLFLHADTLLPDDFKEKVIAIILKEPKNIAGAFLLAINKKGLKYRIVEKTANLRSKFLKNPYGDQAMFMEKVIFEKIGGFDKVVFLEDYLILKKIKKLGRIGMSDSAVLTSSRRWESKGVIKTTIINQIIIIGYLLGFSIPNLKKLYGISQKG